MPTDQALARERALARHIGNLGKTYGYWAVARAALVALLAHAAASTDHEHVVQAAADALNTLDALEATT